MTESFADSSSVRFWRWLTVIATLGLIVRVAYILTFSSHSTSDWTPIGALGRKVGGVRVGIVTGTLAAVSPALIGFDASLMSETLCVPIVAGLLLMT